MRSNRLTPLLPVKHPPQTPPSPSSSSSFINRASQSLQSRMGSLYRKCRSTFIPAALYAPRSPRPMPCNCDSTTLAATNVKKVCNDCAARRSGLCPPKLHHRLSRHQLLLQNRHLQLFVAFSTYACRQVALNVPFRTYQTVHTCRRPPPAAPAAAACCWRHCWRRPGLLVTVPQLPSPAALVTRNRRGGQASQRKLDPHNQLRLCRLGSAGGNKRPIPNDSADEAGEKRAGKKPPSWRPRAREAGERPGSPFPVFTFQTKRTCYDPFRAVGVRKWRTCWALRQRASGFKCCSSLMVKPAWARQHGEGRGQPWARPRAPALANRHWRQQRPACC